jgi:hypothetical protein
MPHSSVILHSTKYSFDTEIAVKQLNETHDTRQMSENPVLEAVFVVPRCEHSGVEDIVGGGRGAVIRGRDEVQCCNSLKSILLSSAEGFCEHSQKKVSGEGENAVCLNW